MICVNIVRYKIQGYFIKNEYLLCFLLCLIVSMDLIKPQMIVIKRINYNRIIIFKQLKDI